jgi:hypothetical protein
MFNTLLLINSTGNIINMPKHYVIHAVLLVFLSLKTIVDLRKEVNNLQSLAAANTHS